MKGRNFHRLQGQWTTMEPCKGQYATSHGPLGPQKVVFWFREITFLCISGKSRLVEYYTVIWLVNIILEKIKHLYHLESRRLNSHIGFIMAPEKKPATESSIEKSTILKIGMKLPQAKVVFLQFHVVSQLSMELVISWDGAGDFLGWSW